MTHTRHRCAPANSVDLNVSAPGKLNLALRILGRRSDGFHEIQSLMIGVNVCDELHIAHADPGVIQVFCDHPGVPTDETNLVYRAAAALASRARDPVGCRIELIKRVPIGGGMGGGSSDAAATLSALNEMWGVGLGREELSTLGAELGSDVPFFFHVPSAIVGGRGERVWPARIGWSGWVALASTGEPVSTAAVYGRFGQVAKGPDFASPEELCTASSADELRPMLGNDLESAVFAVSPRVKDLRDRMRDLGAVRPTVSGAGCVVFEVFDEQDEAEALTHRLRASGAAAWAAVAAAPIQTSGYTTGG